MNDTMQHPQRPRLIIPETPSPSGLYLPPSPRDLVAAGAGDSDLPPELRPRPPALLLPMSGVPRPEDMLRCAPTPQDLDLPVPDLDEIVGLVADVPFQPAMLLASTLAAEVYHHGRDANYQLSLAAEIYPTRLHRKVEAFVREDPSHLVFDLRHILALQRLLISHAADDPDPPRGLSEEVRLVGAALLGLASALPLDGPPPAADDVAPAWPAWTRFFAQMAAW